MTLTALIIHRWALVRLGPNGKPRTEKSCYAPSLEDAHSTFLNMRAASGKRRIIPEGYEIQDRGPVQGSKKPDFCDSVSVDPVPELTTDDLLDNAIDHMAILAKDFQNALGMPGAGWPEMLDMVTGRDWHTACAHCGAMFTYKEYESKDRAQAACRDHVRACPDNPMVREISILKAEKKELQRALDNADDVLIQTMDERDAARAKLGPAPLACFTFWPKDNDPEGRFRFTTIAGLPLEDQVFIVRYLHRHTRTLASLLRRDYGIALSDEG